MLVGSRIKDTLELENEIEKSGYKFEIKLLDIDVPTKIKLCDRCRKVNALPVLRCQDCGSENFIIDPFLFC